MTKAIEKELNWIKTKGKLKERFAMLSENKEQTLEMQDEILRRIQIKLGKTKEEIKKLISE
jgi:uncharacterized protein YjbJ (UPF0337 family)